MIDWVRLFAVLHWVFLIIALIVAIQIISENRNPYRTLAWLFALIAFPVFGFLSFLLAGRNLSWRQMRRPKTSPEFPYSRKLLASPDTIPHRKESDVKLNRILNRQNQAPC